MQILNVNYSTTDHFAVGGNIFIDAPQPQNSVAQPNYHQLPVKPPIISCPKSMLDAPLSAGLEISCRNGLAVRHPRVLR